MKKNSVVLVVGILAAMLLAGAIVGACFAGIHLFETKARQEGAIDVLIIEALVAPFVAAIIWLVYRQNNR